MPNDPHYVSNMLSFLPKFPSIPGLVRKPSQDSKQSAVQIRYQTQDGFIVDDIFVSYNLASDIDNDAVSEEDQSEIDRIAKNLQDRVDLLVGYGMIEDLNA